MTDYNCFEIRRAGEWSNSFELCVLTYEERFLRRKVITTVHDETILIDLEHTTSLDGSVFPAHRPTMSSTQQSG